MPKATRIPLSIAVSNISTGRSDVRELRSGHISEGVKPRARHVWGTNDWAVVALFSGVGLLTSLIAILFGMQLAFI